MAKEDEEISMQIQALIDGGPLVGGKTIGENNYHWNYHCAGFDPANDPDDAWPIAEHYGLTKRTPTKEDFIKLCHEEPTHCRTIMLLALVKSRSNKAP